MNLYQVEITTDADFVTITVNADDENEAVSIGLGMFDASQFRHSRLFCCKYRSLSGLYLKRNK